MANSNLNFLVCQFGMPLYGVSGVAPFTGNYFWVNPSTGSDGYTGGPQDPFATLKQALTAATAGNNDVIFFTGNVGVAATVAWNKNNTHLIGLVAPSDSNTNAQISVTAGTAPFSPLVNVTATGCIFKNFSALHAAGTLSGGSLICWQEAGGTNYYENVQFQGGGDATTASSAAMSSLTISASNDNLFRECTIGLDSVVRATNANASATMIGNSARNIFRSCIFQANVSAAADLHIQVTVTGMKGWALLDNCSFLNDVDLATTATTMAAAVSVATNAGGSVLVQGGISVGSTVISVTGPVYLNGPIISPTGIAGTRAT